MNPSAMQQALVAAQALYRERFAASEGEMARSAWSERGYDASAAERFGVGYAPMRAGVLRAAGLDVASATAAGLLREDGRELLRHRLSFVLREQDGSLVGLAGRRLGEDGPKYINPPETPLYSKGHYLYGIDEAHPYLAERGALLVEGYLDRIAFALACHPEALATCGTALTEIHAARLSRLCRRATLAFDQDAAGQRATLSAAITLWRAGLVEVAVVQMPDGEDPDSLLRSGGPCALQQAVSGATCALALLARRQLAGCRSHEERAERVEPLFDACVRHPDPCVGRALCGRLETALGLSAGALEGAWEKRRQHLAA